MTPLGSDPKDPPFSLPQSTSGGASICPPTPKASRRFSWACFIAASRGYVDDVVMPEDTREKICRSFAMLRDKQLENPWRKHGNIPL